MSFPSVVESTFFSVAVDPQGDGTFNTICGMTTRGFNETADTNDNTLRDCDDPTGVPYRTLQVQRLSAQITGTAQYNRAQADLMRNLIGRSFTYRFIAGEDAADVVDSGYYEGKFILTSRSIDATDGGYVTSSLTIASDGPYVWHYNAQIIVLDILDLSNRQATHGSSWTANVAGLTAGSSLSATSADGTTLTVGGSGTAKTISGTFANAGNKQITLVETLTTAPNSPKTTIININAV